MSKSRVFLPILILLLSFAGCGKRNSVEGIYIQEWQQLNYFELKPSGEFYAKGGDKEVTGKFEFEIGALTLTYSTGKVARLSQDGKAFVDKEKERWQLWKWGKTGGEYETYCRDHEAAIANRDAISNDLVNIAALAYQYYRRPSDLGGGALSFIGLTTDLAGLGKLTRMADGKNANGTYSILESGTKDRVVLQGIGHELGWDGKNPVRVIMITRAEKLWEIDWERAN